MSDNTEITVTLHKAAAKRLVYGVVLEPESVDLQRDRVSADEIEKAAHEYLRSFRVVGEQHETFADAEVVESFIAPVDYTTDGGVQILKGSWVMVAKIHSDDLWADIEKGAYTGFSIGGQAERHPDDEAT
jgi:hypothetical protein